MAPPARASARTRSSRRDSSAAHVAPGACPATLPGARVWLAPTGAGVRVVVDGASRKVGEAILGAARHLAEASRRAARAELALLAEVRRRCPVVLESTRLRVRARASGAEILVTAVAPLSPGKLLEMAQRRLRRAFPLVRVPSWRCGDFKGHLPRDLQPHQQQAIFASSPEERLVPTGWDSGDTTISNEARLELFQRVAQGRGGGYVGVGSTQNFVLAAWARSRWVWLMDFTRIVVDANRVHMDFIRESPTPKAFMALWRADSRTRGLEVLRARHGSDPARLRKMEHAYLTASRFVSRRFAQLVGWSRKRGYSTWLTSKKQYDHIRRLVLQGRVRALRGDLNGPRTLCGIGEAAKRMGVVIRVLYPSNAEEYKVFRPYKWTFRRNVRNLPSDARSLVLRTYTFSPSRLVWAPGWKGVSKVGFHYSAQPLREFQGQLRLPGLDIKQVMSRLSDPDRDGFSMRTP